MSNRESRIVNLTEGGIFSVLTRLAMPIIATSFVQMAYNLTDMMWVGRVGSDAVAAVGTAGFFTWLANAIILIPKVGAEVGVAQSVGGGELPEARRYVRHSFQMIVMLAVLYAAGLIVFRRPLLSFFRLGDAIESASRTYLVIVALGMPFFTANPIFTAILNGSGDSSTPFRINSVGLVLNIILDPFFIFGLGPIPRLEVAGAATATVIAQMAVTALFIWEARRRPELFSGLKFTAKPDPVLLKRITKMGLPVAVQSGLFTFISMVVARIVAQWGALPIAVQKVGSQIESISWLTVGGFQSAMSAFIGQNYGGRRWERVYKGYFTGLSIAGSIGVVATLLLALAAEPLFAIFIPEAEAIALGVVYLRILSVSQFWMAVEILTAGAFIGQGRTAPPAIISITFNALRIPGALLLSATSLGLKGVWWAVSITSIFKGLILAGWYLRSLYTNPALSDFRRGLARSESN